MQEIIKNSFNKKYIYIDDIKGSWAKDYDYSEFIMPTDMHQVLLSQVNEMGELNHIILEIISIFESAISLEIIKGFLEDYNVS